MDRSLRQIPEANRKCSVLETAWASSLHATAEIRLTTNAKGQGQPRRPPRRPRAHPAERPSAPSPQHNRSCDFLVLLRGEDRPPLAMLCSNKRIRYLGKTQGPGELPYPQSPTAHAEYHNMGSWVSGHSTSLHVLLRAHPCPRRPEGRASSTLRVDFRGHGGDGPRSKTRRIGAVSLPLPAATASGRVRTRSTSRTRPGRTRRRPWPTRTPRTPSPLLKSRRRRLGGPLRLSRCKLWSLSPRFCW